MKIPIEVSWNIDADISMGIYDNFEKLKKQLQNISNKIINAHYCINADTLTTGEVITLRRNDYISEHDLLELTNEE